MRMSRMVNNLIANGALKTDVVIEAFSEIQRIEFVPEDFHNSADADIPLPIGHGEMIAEPQIAAVMMEILDPNRGQNTLVVGISSGWMTALLGYIVGPEGHVTAVDEHQSLVQLGSENIDKYQMIKRGIVEVVLSQALEGCPDRGPFDRILVTIPLWKDPISLKKQLKVGGVMVMPMYNKIRSVRKEEDGFTRDVYPGFSYVPLSVKG